MMKPYEFHQAKIPINTYYSIHLTKAAEFYLRSNGRVSFGILRMATIIAGNSVDLNCAHSVCASTESYLLPSVCVHYMAA